MGLKEDIESFKKSFLSDKKRILIEDKHIATIDSSKMYVVRPTSIYGSKPKRKKASAFSKYF